MIYVLLLSALIAASSSSTISTVEDLCGACRCDDGDYPATAECGDVGEIAFEATLPSSLNRLSVINGLKVAFRRGAVRHRRLDIEIDGVTEEILFEPKSVTIMGGVVGVIVSSSSNVGKLSLESRCVSAEQGDFRLNVDGLAEVDVAEQTFDVLSQVSIRNVGRLNLASKAFKPNVPLLARRPQLNITIKDVKEIPFLPSHTFTSAFSIEFDACRINQVAKNAFSANHIKRVVFTKSAIDRVHENAFPDDGSFIEELFVHDCVLTTVSKRSFSAASSRLTLSSSFVSALSSEAFACQAANVIVQDNHFKTLAARGFVLSSWSEFRFRRNRVDFMTENAFSGVLNDDDSESVFEFSDNFIAYANMDALAVSLPTAETVVNNNTFGRECECDIDNWLTIVSGRNSAILPKLLNSSLCAVPVFTQKCFLRPHVAVADYIGRLCGGDASMDQCDSFGIVDFIEKVRKVIPIRATNSGLLLVILLCAVAFSLIVSIFTLLRWIIYTLEIRRYDRKMAAKDWDFTKIEERISEKSPVEDHYERLPIEEEPEEELEDRASSSPIRDEKSSLIANEEKKPMEEVEATSKRVSVGAPPKMTFYDEMIDIIREKLDDPDNYATVADLQPKGTQELYQDPMEVNKK